MSGRPLSSSESSETYVTYGFQSNHITYKSWEVYEETSNGRLSLTTTAPLIEFHQFDFRWECTLVTSATNGVLPRPAACPTLSVRRMSANDRKQDHEEESPLGLESRRVPSLHGIEDFANLFGGLACDGFDTFRFS